jgi:hypothetical protein
MAFQYYNRYTPFQNNGQTSVVPYIPLTTKPSDKIYVYKVGRSRLDKVSQEYYGTPFFSWLILQANPEFGGLENNIIDGSTDGGAVFTSIVNGSFVQMVTLFGLASPNTTSAVSYKVKFKSANSANSTITV